MKEGVEGRIERKENNGRKKKIKKRKESYNGEEKFEVIYSNSDPTHVYVHNMKPSVIFKNL